MDTREEIDSGCEPFQDHWPFRRTIRTRLTAWVRFLSSANSSSLIGRSSDVARNRVICRSLRCSGRSIRWTPQK